MQDKVIVYNNVEHGSLNLCFPCSNIHTLEDVALKDVPAGVPYKILDIKDLPQSEIFRQAWTYDFKADSDGVGMGADAFFKERGYT
jgi:hypothetical protein